MPYEFDPKAIDDEIRAIVEGQFKNNQIRYTDDQISLIVRARDAGMNWKNMVKYLSDKGIPGSQNTLRRAYEDRKDKEAK